MLSMMRQRLAYFSAVAEEYESFDQFVKKHEMWLAIFGIGLNDCGDYLKIHINTGADVSEDYFIVVDEDGFLTVSDVVALSSTRSGVVYVDIESGKISKNAINGNK